MTVTKQRVRSALVEIARLSRLPRLLGGAFGGVGAILALHRVRRASDDPFQPNKSLEVTPEFLDRAISQIRDLGFDIVSLDEMQRRLVERDFEKRFVCLTLDDGYADNYREAYPVFKAHRAPFSIYLTTGFVDHTAFFWWMHLEEILRRRDEVILRLDDREIRFGARTAPEKQTAFEALHRRFRQLPADQVEPVTERFCADHDIEPAVIAGEQAMTWEMARDITANGLGTIEAHTERHIALSLQRPDDIEDEMARVFTRIAERTGRAPRHFAYPFGDADAVSKPVVGLLAGLPPMTAVTTQPGMLRSEHAGSLTRLPRIMLNGYYQSAGYVDLTLSGLPYALSRS